MDRNFVLNGNKLIAEFMGAKLNCESGLEVNFHMNKFGYKIGNGNETFNSLKFHKSWDWLMPVVEKIESTKPGLEVDIYKNKCQIDFGISSPKFRCINISELSKLKSTYQAVIKFIEWYNENKDK